MIEARIEIPEGILPTDDLPDGWILTSTGSIADVVGGGTPKSSESENFSEGGHPWITPADLSGFKELYIRRGRRGLSEKGLRSCSAVVVPAGAVLMSSRAPIGYVAIAAEAVCTNQGFKSFVCHSEIDSEFVYFWLRLITPHLEEMGSGSTFAEISGSRAKEIPMLLAPAIEQRRISAQIKRTLPSVNSARNHLSRVSLILRRFRQAVLAAACSGRLTEDWREANRRSLEEHWREVELSDICDSISDGDHQPPPKQTTGVPFLTIGNVSSGCLDFSETRFVSEQYFKQIKPERKPRRGDVLYTVVGATIGIPVLVDVDRQFCFQRHIALLRASKETTPEFLWTLMASPEVFKEAWSRVTGSAQPTLPLGNLRTISISVPPLAEQEEITRRVQALLELADTIQARVGHATLESEKLTQSILAQAFRGELVPTEAELARREGREYEPASVLLERIKTQRESHASSKPEPKRTRTKSKVAV